MPFKPVSRALDNNLFSIKSKRSQSALEYMMTYGWAILIIVIVAVILYSMGIFNPSSSVTFTSSGFSPFTVSSSLCNNLGYKIAIIAGPIPDNANSLQIDKVFLTSATGANTTTASYALTNPVSLKSGQTATILVPNVACTAAGIHYSLSASIQYSYSTTAGNVVQNTTGTVAGTSITGKPAVLTSYEPLTITNSQSSATPNPFQQMINFTSSDSGWTSISTGNFGQNVEFFYYNGTVIPSWLESYSSTNAIWWLKIAAIPAGSSETVYVGFAPSTTNLFNNFNDGEAPQLSATYGEYDDGANVFIQYGGASWSSFTFIGGHWTTSNGYLQQTWTNGSYGGGPAALIESTAYPANGQYVLGAAFNYTTEADARVGIIAVATPTSAPDALGYRFIGQQGSGGAGFISFLNDQIAWIVDNTYQGAVSTDYTLVVTDAAGTWSGALYSGFGNEGSTPLTTLSPTIYTNANKEGSTSGYVGISAAYCGSACTEANPINVMWFYMRAYPPNGVMPNVYFGEVS